MDNDKSYVPEGKPYKYCSNCGAKIDLNAEICPACGVAQTVIKPSGNNPGIVDLGGHKDYKKDIEGLDKIKFGALLGIIGLIFTMVPSIFIYGIYGAIISAARNTSASASGLAGVSTTLIGGVGVSILIGIILSLASIIEYRHAFGILKESNPSLASPYSLMKWIYIGLILSLIMIPIAMISVLATLASANHGSSGPLPGLILTFSAIALIGIIAGIMSLVGYIGMILGIYRSGEVFDRGAMKIGAILYIIPYVNIIAPILIYIAAHSAGKTLKE